MEHSIELAPLVAYQPASQASFVLDTLMPRNLAPKVQESLKQLTEQHGQIDAFVRDALKYPSLEVLWKSLAAEQIDAIGLYIRQFHKNQGIIIADQTGIGKGRQAAAVIRHAIMQGYLPIFFTKTPSLFTDLYRDLQAIGMTEIAPLILNTDTQASIKDEHGNTQYRPLSAKAQHDLLTITKKYPIDSPEALEWYTTHRMPIPDPEANTYFEIAAPIDYLPEAYNMIIATYSQVQAAAPYKRDWLSALLKAGIEGNTTHKKAVFILDESHMAGGFESKVGKWMRAHLVFAKSCCYLSATFAKYPEVMPLYAVKTALQETQLKEDKLVYAMSRGGLVLQEIIATHLAQSGQLIRRQRSSEGVAVYYETLDQEPIASQHKAQVDRVTTIMSRIVAFEREYITPILEERHADMLEKGNHVDKRPKQLGVYKSPYFSSVFNIIDQLLFAVKTTAVVAKAVRLLKEDKKVVIAFKSTMGMFLKSLNAAAGDVLSLEDLDFVQLLKRGLAGVFRYRLTDLFDKKTYETIDLTELSALGQEVYAQLLKAIEEERSGLNVSPIDMLIHGITTTKKPKELGGHQGSYFKVAEVTGRPQRLSIDTTNASATVTAFRSDAEKAFREFNNGAYDVLLINQSGSTGASAHASSTFKDQRKRAMLIHQFELDINIEVQKRGRIHRTGQVQLPEYYYITSSVPTERRLMTMLKGKLKSLDANTTGSQHTNDATLDSADFFNKYGDQVAYDWITEHSELHQQLGYPTFYKERENGQSHWVRSSNKEGAIRQLTGRAGLLNVQQQEELYQELLQGYQQAVALAKQEETYDLEIPFLPLAATIQRTYMYKHGSGGKSPFGRATLREVCIVRNLNKPFTRQEIEIRMEKALQEKRPAQVQSLLQQTFVKAYPTWIEKRHAKQQIGIKQLEDAIAFLPTIDSTTTAEEIKKITRDRKRLEQQVQAKIALQKKQGKQLKQIGNRIKQYLGTWEIGQLVKIPRIAEEYSWGIFLGVHIGSTKNNPYTLGNIHFSFAVADHRKRIQYHLGSESIIRLERIVANSLHITDAERLTIFNDWNRIIKKQSSAKQLRHLLTENIVGVADQLTAKRKIVTYTMDNGHWRQGILTEIDFNEEEAKTQYTISHAYKKIQQLSYGAYLQGTNNGVFIRGNGATSILLSLEKRSFYTLYTDQLLRDFLVKTETGVLGEFVQNAMNMEGEIPLENLKNALHYLDTKGIIYYDKAEEIKKLDQTNEASFEKETQEKKATHAYRLRQPYGLHTNPSSGFIRYEEPTKTIPFGLIWYSRPLGINERLNYSILPHYTTAKQPYQEWKSHHKTQQTVHDEILKKVADYELIKAFTTLGRYMHNTAHESGNPEFVFGDFTLEQLGRVFFEDRIRIAPMEIVLAQLQLAIKTIP